MTPATAGHGLGPTRARVLALLQTEGGMSIPEVAANLVVHNNTARFHLEALVEAGYVRRRREAPHGQGRPRTLYLSSEAAPRVDVTHLRDLTQVLVRQFILGAPEPDAVAEQVGRAWGEEAGRATLGEEDEAHRDDDIGSLLQHTGEMGFAGERVDAETIEFHSCPYRNMGQPTRDGVCRIYLGMLRGFLDARDSDVEVASLTPGEVCVARLKLRPRAEASVEG